MSEPKIPAEAVTLPDMPDPLSQRLPDTLLLIAAIGLLVFALGFLFAPGQFETADVTRTDGSIVATVDPLATEAGLAILRSGGNAVDAAVAAAAVLGAKQSGQFKTTAEVEDDLEIPAFLRRF